MTKVFTSADVARLKREFRQEPYPSREKCNELSSQTFGTAEQIRGWFSRRRAHIKGFTTKKDAALLQYMKEYMSDDELLLDVQDKLNVAEQQTEDKDAQIEALKKQLEEKDALLKNAVDATKTMNDALINLALKEDDKDAQIEALKKEVEEKDAKLATVKKCFATVKEELEELKKNSIPFDEQTWAYEYGGAETYNGIGMENVMGEFKEFLDNALNSPNDPRVIGHEAIEKLAQDFLDSLPPMKEPSDDED